MLSARQTQDGKKVRKKAETRLTIRKNRKPSRIKEGTKKKKKEKKNDHEKTTCIFACYPPVFWGGEFLVSLFSS